jgi:hypothetical protein
VKSYVVRLYRKTKGRADVLVGVIEEAGTTKRRVFTTLDELWGYLASSRVGSPRRKRRAGTA